MHSIKTKLLALVCGAIIGIFALLGAVGMYYAQWLIERDSAETLTILAQQKSKELNEGFERVERAVDAEAEYIQNNSNPKRMRMDKQYLEDYMEELSIRMREEAQIVGIVTALYFRPDPEVYGPITGFFLAENGSGDYISVVPTNILQYVKSDTEHVGWYYQPIESGTSMWMEPYYNDALSTYMVSYVYPVYIDEKLLGVLGMDVSMATIHNVVDTIDYGDGMGFLVGEDGALVYHREYPEGLETGAFTSELKAMKQYLTQEQAEKGEIERYRWHGEWQRMITTNLENGMVLAISVPESEIMSPRTFMAQIMLGLFVLILGVAMSIAWRVMVRIILPIQELTTASARISKGELNTPITYQSKDEIGKLAESVRMMSKELREYIDYIHAQAYTDAMTGVGNKAAYMDMTKLLDRKIYEDMADFAIIVFDVNGLKRINDNLGHEYGDMLISDAANVLKKVFGQERVYRIGGDEFIVVLEHATEKDVKNYYQQYNETIVAFNEGEKGYDSPLAISKGYSIYSREEDREYKDVFKRADGEMYKDKELYYQGRNDRRRK